jgi:hypothetical protein
MKELFFPIEGIVPKVILNLGELPSQAKSPALFQT